jgi:hypothetical protein
LVKIIVTDPKEIIKICVKHICLFLKMKQLHKKGTVVISRVSERWTAGWRSLYASKKASNQPNRLRISAFSSILEQI